MNRLIQLSAAFLLLAALSGSVSAEDEAAAPAPWAARITSFKGDVRVQLPGSDPAPAQEDMSLPEGTVVKTGSKSTAELALDGEGIIELQPNSDFKVESLKHESTWFHLSFGTIVAKLRKLAKNDNLEIRSASAVAAVRGTEFGVSVDEDGSKVGVFDEGLVAVKSPAGSEVQLSPNQESSVLKGMGPSAPQSLKYFSFYQDRVKKIRKRIDTIRNQWRKKNDLRRRGLRRKLERLERKK